MSLSVQSSFKQPSCAAAYILLIECAKYLTFHNIRNHEHQPKKAKSGIYNGIEIVTSNTRNLNSSCRRINRKSVTSGIVMMCYLLLSATTLKIKRKLTEFQHTVVYTIYLRRRDLVYMVIITSVESTKRLASPKPITYILPLGVMKALVSETLWTESNSSFLELSKLASITTQAKSAS